LASASAPVEGRLIRDTLSPQAESFRAPLVAWIASDRGLQSATGMTAARTPRGRNKFRASPVPWIASELEAAEISAVRRAW